MNLLPYEQFSIETALPPYQVTQALSAQVRSRSWVNRWTSGSPYEGRVDSYWFEIRRVQPWWTKARSPLVIGSVQPTGVGSTLAVTVRPDTAEIIGLALVPVLFLAFSWPAGLRGMAFLLPLGLVMTLIFYVVLAVRFSREAIQARSFLQGVLGTAGLYAGTTTPAGYAPYMPAQPTWGSYPAPQADGRDTQRLPGGAGVDWYHSGDRAARG